MADKAVFICIGILCVEIIMIVILLLINPSYLEKIEGTKVEKRLNILTDVMSLVSSLAILVLIAAVLAIITRGTALSDSIQLWRY